jgi:hypothetical protein
MDDQRAILASGMNLELYYGSSHIGQIEDAFWSDDTGFGVFRPSLIGEAATIERIRAFIAFSEEWHEKLKTGNPQDASEFDSFSDIHSSDQWHTISPDGSVTHINAPAFIQGEVTWRPSSSINSVSEQKN